MRFVEMLFGIDEIEVPDDLGRPLEIAMVIKGLDTEGKVAYWTASTPNLMNVEIVGMMRWGESVALYADKEP